VDAVGERFRIGRVVARSFRIWGGNLPLLLVTALLVHIPRVACVEALHRALPSPRPRTGESLLVWFLGILPGAFVQDLVAAFLRNLSLGLVVFAVYHRLQGHRSGIRDSVRAGLRQLLPVLWVSLALSVLEGAFLYPAWALVLGLVRGGGTEFPYGAMVVGATIGFPVVAAVVLSPFWVAVPEAVVDSRGRALRRSWQLTHGHRLAVLLILLFLAGVRWGSFRLLMPSLRSAAAHPLVWRSVGWANKLILVTLQAVFAAVGYHALRLENEGVDVPDLEKVFA
jgi:hypothetical protein